MRTLNKIIMVLALSCILILLDYTVTRADDFDTDSKFYITINMLDKSIGDSFDGSGANFSTINNNILILTPKLTDGDGLGFAFGEIRGRFAGEVYYMRSLHQGTNVQMPINSNCTFEEFGLNFKFFFFKPSSPFNVYCLLGGGIPKVTYSNGAWDETDPNNIQYDDASFSGTDYNTGVGFTIKINSKLILEGSYIVNQITINNITVQGESFEPVSNFSATGHAITIGLVCLL